MKLKVLGSSSAGNCYFLQHDFDTLILEAGIPVKEVKKALDFDMRNVLGCLITHEHGDHASRVREYVKSGIPYWCSAGTHDALQMDQAYYHHCRTDRATHIGGFNIKPFPVKHDAAEPYGYYISHKEAGKMVFITDTYYVPYRFNDLDHILIECNYSRDKLDSMDIAKLRNRTLTSHMDLETCKDFIRANKGPNLKTVVLLHLSDRNSDEERFVREVAEIAGCPTYAAKTGMEIDLSAAPF